MPFASRTLFEHMHALLIEEAVDVVIPQSEEGLEPLHAVYRRATCVPAIEAAIETDQWKVIAWFLSGIHFARRSGGSIRRPAF
jgi:molybdopterin-guanine dinucleotide biosynthesis protein A